MESSYVFTPRVALVESLGIINAKISEVVSK